MKTKNARILLLLSLLIVIYLTLYPFNFANLSHEFDLRLLFLHKKHHILSDICSNFLLFMPIGFFWNFSGSKRHFVGVLALVIFVLPFSFFIEYLQQFLPSRDPSIIDVIFNTAGALSGYIFTSIIRKLPTIKISFVEMFSFLMAILLLCEPFIISLDIGDLKHKIKTISYTFNFSNILLPSFFLAYALRRYSIFYLIASLLTLEFLRIFIVSIVIAPLKFLFRLFFSSVLFSSLKKDNTNFVLLSFSVCYFLEALSPFKFTYSPNFNISAFIPFKYFIDNVSFSAVFILLKQLLCFTFWGLLDGPYIWAAALAFVSEAVQLFVVGRYADTTTILLAIFGVLFGKSLRIKRPTLSNRSYFSPSKKWERIR
ncbi:VanZ family protein [Thermodesulfatator atlanticus]